MIVAAGIKTFVFRQYTLAGDEVHLDANAVGIFTQNIIISGRPGAFLGRADNMGIHLHQQCRDCVHVLAGPGAETDVVQPNPALHEPLARMFG